MEKKLIVRLNELNLEMVDYNLDANLDCDETYMTKVLDGFVGGIDLDTVINEALDGCVDIDFNALVESSKYIEDSIDAYLSDVGAKDFRSILIGGQCEYYKRQLYKNECSFYMNAVISTINSFKNDVLSENIEDEAYISKELPILLCEDPMEVIETFANELVDSSACYSPITEIDTLMSKFNEFVNSEL